MRLPKKLLNYMQDLAIHLFLTHPVYIDFFYIEDIGNRTPLT